MVTTAEPTPLNPSLIAPDEQRFVLGCATWEDYEKALSLLEGRHVRATFDRGILEIMTTSSRHEMGKKLLARLVETLFDEMDVSVIAVGSTTWKRRALERGLEPDECWYVHRAAQVRGKRDIDLETSPAPDFAIEVEISRSVIPRLGIYAALGVSEVWRYDGSTVQFCVLQSDGQYKTTDQSTVIPKIKPADFVPFLNMREREFDTAIVKAFRKWVQSSLLK